MKKMKQSRHLVQLSSSWLGHHTTHKRSIKLNSHLQLLGGSSDDSSNLRPATHMEDLD